MKLTTRYEESYEYRGLYKIVTHKARLFAYFGCCIHNLTSNGTFGDRTFQRNDGSGVCIH